MSENRRVTRAAGLIGAATLLSRILGFVRDAVIAGFFGADLRADAFFVAFRIPNLMRRLFTEGALSVAFVPVFTGFLTREGREAALGFAGTAIRLAVLLLMVISFIGWLAAPLLVRIMAPGFVEHPGQFGLTVLLTRIMFPYVFFVGLLALAMGILNSLEHFAAPALAPILLNIAMISAVFLIAPLSGEPTAGLAAGVVIGGVLQLALQIPVLWRRGLRFRLRGPLFHPALARVGRQLLPTALGASVFQINVVIATVLASFLPPGSVSWLYYADRLVQFPLGIFAIAAGTAILPSLSRQAARNDLDALGETFAYALRFIFFITFPAMIGLIVLREPIIRLLFQRGAFDPYTTQATADALLCFTLGLWAFSGVRIMISVFYALQDTRTPVRTGGIAILTNLILGIFLMKPLGHAGLALAAALASMFHLFLLFSVLHRRLDANQWPRIVKSACKSLLCSLIMGVVVWRIAVSGISSIDAPAIHLIAGLAVCVGSGILLYGALALLINRSELNHLLAMAGKGVHKR